MARSNRKDPQYVVLKVARSPLSGVILNVTALHTFDAREDARASRGGFHHGGRQPDLLEQRGRPIAALGADLRLVPSVVRPFAREKLLRQRDILQRGILREKVKALKYHSKM